MLEKLKSKSPLKWNIPALIFAFVGGFSAILVLSLLTDSSVLLLLTPPFGASCVLIFAVWEAPLAQPRNIIGGHLISTVIGIAVFQTLGNHPWTLAIGVGLAISMMVFTKTVHPPAGADPLIVIASASAAGWSFLLFPIAAGSLILTALGVLLNRFIFKRAYPKFWW